MFIVMSIGCLECGNESDLLGVYDSVAEAQAAHPNAVPRERKKNWSGSGAEVIFEATVEA